jgi:leucyl/phenylalanyl-tRNA--protein transferase
MGVEFPPVEEASPDGLLAIGGDLNIETLTAAYKSGVFPWPINEKYPLTWFAPNPRGIIDFDDFKISRSMQKFQLKNELSVCFNQDFDKVISCCSKVSRKHEKSTWIHQNIIKGYTELFNAKLAYCVSVYNQEKQLVGGLYGVCFGEIVSGESMFHLVPNASKLALVTLIEKLRNAGLKFLDTQMVTPIVKSFGGKTISRKEFMQRLSQLDSTRSRESLFN